MATPAYGRMESGGIRPQMKMRWLLVIIAIIVTTVTPENVEVCSGEIFSARCGSDEVIVMDTAIYGRMSVGKCIRKQQDHMGCSNEVLALADRWCSGRRSCQTIIPNPELDVANQDCQEYLKLYFKVTYHCIKVFAEEPSKCETLARVALPASHGFISSQVTDETGCVSLRAPGIIQAASGQRIKFTLLDFATTKRKRSAGPVYGYIMDKTVQINKTIYGGGQRERDIYTSESAVVEIALSTKDERHQDGDFLLKYEAVGCADLDTPPDAWYKRKGNNATIGCKNNPRIWKLRCDGRKWIGTVGNCSLASIGASTEEEEKTGLSFMFFIITGVAAAIVLLVIVVVVACVCHKKKSINDESRRTVITPTSPSRSGTTTSGRKPAAGKYKSIECTGPDDLVYNVNARHQPITFNKDGISPMCDRPRLDPGSALAQVMMLTQPEPAYQPNADLLDLTTPSPTEVDSSATSMAASATTLGPPPALPDCPPPGGVPQPHAQYEMVQVKMRPKSIYKDGDPNGRPLGGGTSRPEPPTPKTPPLPTRKEPLSLVSSSDSSPTSPEPGTDIPEVDGIYVNESVALSAGLRTPGGVGSPTVPRRPPRKCDDEKRTGDSTRTPSPGNVPMIAAVELAASLARQVAKEPEVAPPTCAEDPDPDAPDDLPPPPPPPEENYYNLDELTGVPKEDPTIPILPDPPVPPAPLESYYSNDPQCLPPVSTAPSAVQPCGECYYNNCDCPGDARKKGVNV